MAITTSYRGLCTNCRLVWKNSGHCNVCGSDELISVSPKFRAPRRTQVREWRKIAEGNLHTRGRSMAKKMEAKSSDQDRYYALEEQRIPRKEYREIKRALEGLEHISAFKQKQHGLMSLEVSPGITRDEVHAVAQILIPVIQGRLKHRSFALNVFGEGTLMVARGFAPQAPRRKRWWALTQEAVLDFQKWLREDLEELFNSSASIRANHGVIQVHRRISV